MGVRLHTGGTLALLRAFRTSRQGRRAFSGHRPGLHYGALSRLLFHQRGHLWHGRPVRERLWKLDGKRRSKSWHRRSNKNFKMEIPQPPGLWQYYRANTVKLCACAHWLIVERIGAAPKTKEIA